MTALSVTINGRNVAAEAGETVLEAASVAGIRIPTLCNHPALRPIGACRMCLVEVAGQPALQTACTLIVAEGMDIQTHSSRVDEARRFVLDMLLSDHPLDCLACEEAGSCELQDLAYQYGIRQTSFPGIQHDCPIVTSNPFFERDYRKCILCLRCVRACDEINGGEAIGAILRGFESKVGTAFDLPMQDSNCEFCGMCVEVCPTGALSPLQGKGQGRVWEIEKVATTCPYCGVGCQFYLNVKNGRIIGVSSKWDAPANHGWTCVKGRFGWDYVHHSERLIKPLIRQQRDGELQEAEWDEALEFVASKLADIKHQHGAGAFGALSSAKCTNEENFAMQKFARAVMGTNNVDHCARL